MAYIYEDLDHLERLPQEEDPTKKVSMRNARLLFVVAIATAVSLTELVFAAQNLEYDHDAYIMSQK